MPPPVPNEANLSVVGPDSIEANDIFDLTPDAGCATGTGGRVELVARAYTLPGVGSVHSTGDNQNDCVLEIRPNRR